MSGPEIRWFGVTCIAGNEKLTRTRAQEVNQMQSIIIFTGSLVVHFEHFDSHGGESQYDADGKNVGLQKWHR